MLTSVPLQGRFAGLWWTILATKYVMWSVSFFEHQLRAWQMLCLASDLIFNLISFDWKQSSSDFLLEWYNKIVSCGPSQNNCIDFSTFFLFLLVKCLKSDILLWYMCSWSHIRIIGNIIPIILYYSIVLPLGNWCFFVQLELLLCKVNRTGEIKTTDSLSLTETMNFDIIYITSWGSLQ